MKSCDICTNTRLIMSENGLHPVCTLSSKAARNCIMNNYSKFVIVHDWDAVPVEPILEPIIRKEMEETE